MTDLEQRKRLIDSFVNAIYLYDDRIVLTFNYKDGTKHISLEEVKSSDLAETGRPYRRGRLNVRDGFSYVLQPLPPQTAQKTTRCAGERQELYRRNRHSSNIEVLRLLCRKGKANP